MRRIKLMIKYFGCLSYHKGIDRLSIIDWLYGRRLGWGTTKLLVDHIMESKRSMTCTNGNCEVTQSPDFKLKKLMPLPTASDINHPLFEPIWAAIQGKHLECPEYYEGWQVATGCHVKIIIDQIKVVE